MAIVNKAFKVGDRVRIVGKEWIGHPDYNPLGELGKIIGTDGVGSRSQRDYEWRIQLDRGQYIVGDSSDLVHADTPYAVGDEGKTVGGWRYKVLSSDLEGHLRVEHYRAGNGAVPLYHTVDGLAPGLDDRYALTRKPVGKNTHTPDPVTDKPKRPEFLVNREAFVVQAASGRGGLHAFVPVRSSKWACVSFPSLDGLDRRPTTYEVDDIMHHLTTGGWVHKPEHANTLAALLKPKAKTPFVDVFRFTYTGPDSGDDKTVYTATLNGDRYRVTWMEGNREVGMSYMIADVRDYLADGRWTKLGAVVAVEATKPWEKDEPFYITAAGTLYLCTFQPERNGRSWLIEFADKDGNGKGRGNVWGMNDVEANVRRGFWKLAEKPQTVEQVVTINVSDEFTITGGTLISAEGQNFASWVQPGVVLSNEAVDLVRQYREKVAASDKLAEEAVEARKAWEAKTEAANAAWSEVQDVRERLLIALQ